MADALSLDEREALEIQRAIALSLQDQGPSNAPDPSVHAPCSPSPRSNKRARDDDAPARSSPSKRTASPPPSGSLYVELIQHQLELLERNPSLLSQPSFGIKLERWQQVALAMANSLEMRTRAPMLAERLFEVALGADAGKVHGAQDAPEVERWDEGFDLYSGGAFRKTRTPKRAARGETNCIELRDFIKKESLLSMGSSTFLLEHEAIASLLPIEGSGPHSKRTVPLFIARDINADLLRPVACEKVGIKIAPKADLRKKHGDKVAPALTDLYYKIAGKNWNATYPYARGCSHTKLMALRYPGWLLVVITSANTMRIDTELSDNHWFLMSFPELPKRGRKGTAGPFEQMLLQHLDQLDISDEFLNSIKLHYDFSAADGKVHLVASEPGVRAGKFASSYGALRLAALAKKLIPRKARQKGRVELKICSGSVGEFKDEWIKRMDWVVKGRNLEELRNMIGDGEDEELEVPNWVVVFPTKENVKGCEDEVREAASNIGCSLDRAKWPAASPAVRAMFHDYTSKDAGRLFHQKFILWHDTEKESASASTSAALASTPSGALKTPYMLYIGSHNFSQSAFGLVEVDRQNGGLKLTKMANYELGVVVAGKDIEGMLEPGSTWEDIVTYERPLRRYAEGESPWNSPAWVKELQEEG
ncbi:hypothetical protein JCM6882_007906 [Rhodosporidiobolus microsporus]